MQPGSRHSSAYSGAIPYFVPSSHEEERLWKVIQHIATQEGVACINGKPQPALSIRESHVQKRSCGCIDGVVEDFRARFVCLVDFHHEFSNQTVLRWVRRFVADAKKVTEHHDLPNLWFLKNRQEHDGH